MNLTGNTILAAGSRMAADSRKPFTPPATGPLPAAGRGGG